MLVLLVRVSFSLLSGSFLFVYTVCSGPCEAKAKRIIPHPMSENKPDLANCRRASAHGNIDANHPKKASELSPQVLGRSRKASELQGKGGIPLSSKGVYPLRAKGVHPFRSKGSTPWTQRGLSPFGREGIPFCGKGVYPLGPAARRLWKIAHGLSRKRHGSLVRSRRQQLNPPGQPEYHPQSRHHPIPGRPRNCARMHPTGTSQGLSPPTSLDRKQVRFCELRKRETTAKWT